MRNQDSSKSGSSAYACVEHAFVRLHNRARALMKMLPHPHSLNKRTLYALDLTPPYSNHTKRVNYSLIAQTQAFRRRCAAVSQAAVCAFVWVKTLHSWHFLRRLENPTGHPPTAWLAHGTHPSNLFLYFRLDSSYTQANRAMVACSYPTRKHNSSQHETKAMISQSFPSQGYPVGFFL